MPEWPIKPESARHWMTTLARTAAYERALAAAWEARARVMFNLITAHNTECDRMCGLGDQEGVACGYRPYFPRHCPDCPKRSWKLGEEELSAIGPLPPTERAGG